MAFTDVDIGAPAPASATQGVPQTPPESPTKMQAQATRGFSDSISHRRTASRNSLMIPSHKKQDSWTSIDSTMSITIPSPTSNSHNTIEVPAMRSPDADASKYMHILSKPPSEKERRLSRNSFGSSLPIPRSKRQSRLSSVTFPEVQEALRTVGQPTAMLGDVHPNREILASQVQDMQAGKVKAAKNMAFVFDIDGVLVHGDRLIPEGKMVLDMLNGDNELGIKIPHIFLTNGSGKPELPRCQQLSHILHNPVSTDQFIQSHTPMRALAEYYNTVLVVGGEGYRCRDVAEEYGFKDIVVPNDIVAWDTTVAPYRVFTEEERASSRPRDFTQCNIDAILVFSDSRDYATDMQIIMDLLRSENGRYGTVAKDPVSQRIPIYFSQGDMLCPTEHPIPRMSQGAFRIGLEAMYKALTGVDLERVVYGKPETATYKYADEVIASWMDTIHGEERIPENVYMIGDNPASDIVGGNMYGWNTCLVRTGVFQGGENDEENPANFGVFKNVLEAVKAACRKQLGDDFKFSWDDRVNPVLHGKASAVE
ncbi:HAD-like domain-containing protein [Podospora didyma]|uniref:HAD-like domain-containing protein n=1 Tax=Podospora didyma TaxID=330526 RepID=A0AAE0NYL1_9PEZI|nr:HAD-like domain-containing protein [Podospora didyma]